MELNYIWMTNIMSHPDLEKTNEKSIFISCEQMKKVFLSTVHIFLSVEKENENNNKKNP